MQRPVILVPSARSDEGAIIPRYQFNQKYIEAVKHAGGIPMGIMRPDVADLGELFPSVDGLLLMGGYDIDPVRYGEQNRSCIACEPARDELELALLKHAMAQKLPILVICRGFQILNTFMGGTLFQDIEHEMPDGMQHDFHFDADHKALPRNFLVHEVTVTPDSILGRCAGTTSLHVNSLHHQGIKTLGAGLRASAYAPDGLIEAIEIEDYTFGLGVQWHPEELGDTTSTNIFNSFIEATKNRTR